MDPKVARELVQLMEQVVEKGGTATRASLIGYRVSGKTGTAFKSIAGGYSTDKIMAVFAGLVPASHPKLATVVVIDEPSRDVHEVGMLAQGGTVAAPVFASVMSGALRLMDVPPDDLQNVPAATLVQANERHERRTHVAARWHRAVPRERCAGDRSDARQPRGARRQPVLRACAGARDAWTEIRGRRGGARRERGAVGAERRYLRRRSLPARRVRGAGARICAVWSAASPTASSAGRPRSCASPASPAPTARPRAPICWRNAWSSWACHAAYIGTIGWGRSTALAAPTHTTPDVVTRAPHAGAAARRGRARGGHGSVLACARSGARRWRALPYRGVHQSDARSPGLSRQHGRRTAPPRRSLFDVPELAAHRGQHRR